MVIIMNQNKVVFNVILDVKLVLALMNIIVYLVMNLKILSFSIINVCAKKIIIFKMMFVFIVLLKLNYVKLSYVEMV